MSTINKTKNNFGFTIIEMIVSLGIFMIVVLIGMSTLLTLKSAEKKAIAIQNILDDLRFTLETVAKDIRIGTDYRCLLPANPDPGPTEIPDPQDCDFSGGGNRLFYQGSDPATSDYIPILYSLSSGKITKTLQGESAEQVTSQSVTIQQLTFYVLGSTHGDQVEPRVTIVIKGIAQVGKEQSPFQLQTSISQRRPEALSD